MQTQLLKLHQPHGSKFASAKRSQKNLVAKLPHEKSGFGKVDKAKVTHVVVIIAGGKGGITQPDFWLQFLQQSNGQLGLAIYVDAQSPRLPQGLGLYKADISKSGCVSAAWSSMSLVIAIAKTLNWALKHYPTAHNFFIVSGDSICIKTWEELSDYTRSVAQSQFLFVDVDPIRNIIWHSAWMRLKRPHAVIMAELSDIAKLKQYREIQYDIIMQYKRCCISDACADEWVFGTHLLRRLGYENMSACKEEWVRFKLEAHYIMQVDMEKVKCPLCGSHTVQRGKSHSSWDEISHTFQSARDVDHILFVRKLAASVQCPNLLS